MATHPPSCGLVSLTLYTIPIADAPGALAHFLWRGSLICPGGSLASYLQGQESTELTTPRVRDWGPAEGMATGRCPGGRSGRSLPAQDLELRGLHKARQEQRMPAIGCGGISGSRGALILRNQTVPAQRPGVALYLGSFLSASP